MSQKSLSFYPDSEGFFVDGQFGFRCHVFEDVIGKDNVSFKTRFDGLQEKLVSAGTGFANRNNRFVTFSPHFSESEKKGFILVFERDVTERERDSK